MARKKAETTESQPKKKASKAASKVQTAAPSGQEIAATGTSAEQAAVPSGAETPATGTLDEQPTSVSGAETAPGTLETPPSAAGESQAASPDGAEAVPGVPGTAPAAAMTPQGTTAVVCSGRGLNLRVGPALSYEVLKVLPDGAEVTALDLPMEAEVPGWRLVFTIRSDLTILTGWVQGRFLRLER